MPELENIIPKAENIAEVVTAETRTQVETKGDNFDELTDPELADLGKQILQKSGQKMEDIVEDLKNEIDPADPQADAKREALDNFATIVKKILDETTGEVGRILQANLQEQREAAKKAEKSGVRFEISGRLEDLKAGVAISVMRTYLVENLKSQKEIHDPLRRKALDIVRSRPEYTEQPLTKNGTPEVIAAYMKYGTKEGKPRDYFSNQKANDLVNIWRAVDPNDLSSLAKKEEIFRELQEGNMLQYVWQLVHSGQRLQETYKALSEEEREKRTLEMNLNSGLHYIGKRIFEDVILAQEHLQQNFLSHFDIGNTPDAHEYFEVVNAKILTPAELERVADALHTQENTALIESMTASSLNELMEDMIDFFVEKQEKGKDPFGGSYPEAGNVLKIWRTLNAGGKISSDSIDDNTLSFLEQYLAGAPTRNAKDMRRLEQYIKQHPEDNDLSDMKGEDASVLVNMAMTKLCLDVRAKLTDLSEPQLYKAHERLLNIRKNPIGKSIERVRLNKEVQKEFTSTLQRLLGKEDGILRFLLFDASKAWFIVTAIANGLISMQSGFKNQAANTWVAVGTIGSILGNKMGHNIEAAVKGVDPLDVWLEGHVTQKATLGEFLRFHTAEKNVVSDMEIALLENIDFRHPDFEMPPKFKTASREVKSDPERFAKWRQDEREKQMKYYENLLTKEGQVREGQDIWEKMKAMSPEDQDKFFGRTRTNSRFDVWGVARGTGFDRLQLDALFTHV